MDISNGISYNINKCQMLSNTLERTFFRGRQHIGAHALCVQHSPTAAALSTSFLLNHAPNSPSALITRFRSYTAALGVNRESK